MPAPGRGSRGGRSRYRRMIACARSRDMRGTQALSFLCIALAASDVAGAAASDSRDVPAAAAPAGSDASAKPATKIAGDLRALYEAYREARSRGVDPRPADRGWPVVDDRVIIDATAAGDPRALETDLTRLGLRNGTAFGRVVSGQLPISAIPALDGLDTLAFAHAAALRRTPGASRAPSP